MTLMLQRVCGALKIVVAIRLVQRHLKSPNPPPPPPAPVMDPSTCKQKKMTDFMACFEALCLFLL